MLIPRDDMPGAPEQAFKEVKVTATPSLDICVSWKLKKSMPAGEGLFVVERSLYGEPFEPVTDRLDDNEAVVERPPIPSPDLEAVSWRVRYMMGGKSYVSMAVMGFRDIDRNDRGLLSVIAHREAVTFHRYSGVPGLFLKTRTSGRACPVCTDYGLEASASSSCPVCYGTGHAGGFYKGRPMDIMMAGSPDTTKKSHPTAGVFEEGNKVLARAMNDYYIDAGDMWIDLRNQERWRIQSVKPEITFKGFVITVKMEMTRVQMSEAEILNNPGVSESLQGGDSEKEKGGDLWETL